MDAKDEAGVDWGSCEAEGTGDPARAMGASDTTMNINISTNVARLLSK
jgi:hypothetical protein